MYGMEIYSFNRWPSIHRILRLPRLIVPKSSSEEECFKSGRDVHSLQTLRCVLNLVLRRTNVTNSYKCVIRVFNICNDNFPIARGQYRIATKKVVSRVTQIFTGPHNCFASTNLGEQGLLVQNLIVCALPYYISVSCSPGEEKLMRITHKIHVNLRHILFNALGRSKRRSGQRVGLSR